MFFTFWNKFIEHMRLDGYRYRIIKLFKYQIWKIQYHLSLLLHVKGFALVFGIKKSSIHIGIQIPPNFRLVI